MNYNQSYLLWQRKSKQEIDATILNALDRNINYYESSKMGVPASHLDKQEFAPDSQVLEGSTFLKTLINNPNHIGVHTDTNVSEPYFAGTQALEKEIIQILGKEVLKAETCDVDGYISSGGTEGNIQAIWIYRNYFNEQFQLNKDYSSITILCSEDSHYSMDKAANLLGLRIEKIQVDKQTRRIDQQHLTQVLQQLNFDGNNKVILVANMMTTMYGSVDNLDDFFTEFDKFPELEVKVHVDGAYGGFFLPFVNPEQALTFKDERISSFTLDAHKMLQAPYGTGIFIIRKNWFKYSLTNSAQYVAGMDCTLIGSRSGANAISVYKIMMNYGPYDWTERMLLLVRRAKVLSNHLDKLGIRHIHFTHSNIITIHHKYVTPLLAIKYGLVPDNHQQAEWFKIVVMEHVKLDKILAFIDDIQLAQKELSQRVQMNSLKTTQP